MEKDVVCDHTAVAPAEVLDPGCGMTLSPTDAVGHIDHKGRTYQFCSQSCLDQFRANPDAFGDEPRHLNMLQALHPARAPQDDRATAASERIDLGMRASESGRS